MRYSTLLYFYLTAVAAIAQNTSTVLSTPETKIDTTATEPQPVGGYRELLAFLEQHISAGDTVGKKTSIPLYAIWFRVNEKGDVDTAYVSIVHGACSIHREVAKVLLQTKWLPATQAGKPVPYEGGLSGRIQVTKAVQKRFRCRWKNP